MTFTNLTHGTVFQVDGAYYQTYRVHGRIVSCLVLDKAWHHVPDPDDRSGLGLKTTLFSDLLVNRYNATPAECLAYLETVRAAVKQNENLLSTVTGLTQPSYRRYSHLR